MKAVVYRDYGPPDVLGLEEVAKPVPAENEVLVRVRAASVNPYDWHFMRGEPYLLRLGAGLGRPKIQRLGADVAGEVEAVGSKVSPFKPGDEVFGTCRGSFAEYACAREASLAIKLAGVTFEQAASLPIAAITALQALRDKGHIQPGHQVLINGASGGVGTFAVQIAKSFGAHVTGVCNASKVETARSLGADHVIDYTRENFTQSDERYDLILDNAGNHRLSDIRKVLTPSGTYVMAGGTSSRWFSFMIRPLTAAVMTLLVRQNLTMVLAKINKEDLAALGELVQCGKVKPMIERRYPLCEVAEAVSYVEMGHARGKVVIVVD
jgi:NADPH:quinone reductase-like Zn-dependent oxidoreductase